MKILLHITKKPVIILIFLIIVLIIFYNFFTYKDLIFSIGVKKGLEGKIIYSVMRPEFRVKSINLPKGKKDILTSASKSGYDFLNHISTSLFSYDGGKIIFSNRGELINNYNQFKLYSINIDGTNMHNFYDLEDISALNFALAPNGGKIVFGVQKTRKGGGLYIADINKPYSSLKMISNIRPATYNPTWSPDGQKISFISDEYSFKRINERWRSETFIGKVFMINSDGTDLRRLKASTPVFWSPDGKIMFYRGEKGYYITNEKETYTHLLIPYTKPPLSMAVGWGLSFAIWSPDGKYIAYVKELWPGMCGVGIYIVPIDNPKKQICITVENSEISDMVWVK